MGSIADLKAGNFNPNHTYEFWLEKKNPNSSYSFDNMGQKKVQMSYPTSLNVKMEYPLSRLNETTKKYESVYVRHVATEHSVFKHEQDEKNGIEKVVTRLRFTKGYAQVKGTDTLLLEAIKNDSRNASNPNRDKGKKAIYFLRDDESAFEKQLIIDDEKFEVVSFVRNPENFDIVLAYARVVLSEQEYKTCSNNPRMVVRRMQGLAEANPQMFKNGIKSPTVLKKHYVLEALEAGELLFDERANAIYWRNGEMIHQTPIGMSPINSFVDKILSDSTGNTESIYNLILGKMNKGAVKQPEHKPYVPIAKTSTGEFDVLFDKLMADGRIIKQGVWHTFNGRKYQGKKAMEKEFNENEAFSQAMKL